MCSMFYRRIWLFVSLKTPPNTIILYILNLNKVLMSVTVGLMRPEKVEHNIYNAELPEQLNMKILYKLCGIQELCMRKGV